MAPSLSTTVAGVQLGCCVYNASGPKSGHISDLTNVGKSMSGCVLSKSSTLVSQAGNAFPRLKKIPFGKGTYCPGSINSEGLPNSGIDYYISESVLTGVAATKKPYIVSLSGLSVTDNVTMLGKVAEAAAAHPGKIAAVELNLACPNVPGKPTVALDFPQMEDVLKQVLSHEGFKASGVPLGIKLAPLFDAPHFDAVAKIINSHKDRVKFVVTTNTIGNCMVIDTETESAIIAPKGGFGGIAGGFSKHVALANVAQLYKRLDKSIDIVGVGGVRSGEDAFQLILCGAAAVQTATTHWLEGPGCFDRIAGELAALMGKKGYASIKDFQGKLKEHDPKQRKALYDPETEKTPLEQVKDAASLMGIALAVFVVLCAVFSPCTVFAELNALLEC
eukprot:TRINITY_DN25025_c0_g1_i1.p1 TRINITY_DN25025_c0_g1~~TRINITY_DN25025_c0_g1_i1.p1  ORF type:complete len:390 (+),score=192.79 TRINITY_DN25025_c0_g1_i1:61-1230(+)